MGVICDTYFYIFKPNKDLAPEHLNGIDGHLCARNTEYHWLLGQLLLLAYHLLQLDIGVKSPRNSPSFHFAEIENSKVT